MPTSTTTVEPRHYPDVMGHLPTSVVVIAGRDERGHPAGLVVGTFQSLSLNPPLVTFSVATTSSSWPRIRPAGRLSASVLGSGQNDLCRALSTKREDKFASVDWHESVDGTPRISGAHAWIDCTTVHELEGGDHVIVIAEVRHMEAGQGEPLVFHRGNLGGYRAIST